MNRNRLFVKNRIMKKYSKQIILLLIIHFELQSCQENTDQEVGVKHATNADKANGLSAGKSQSSKVFNALGHTRKITTKTRK